MNVFTIIISFPHSGALLCGQHGDHSSPSCQRYFASHSEINLFVTVMSVKPKPDVDLLIFRGCDCILSSCQRQPQKPLVCFLRLTAPVLLSQSSATQTANRLTPCSSLQMHQAQHPARPEIMDMDSALILLCKWAEQMTSVLQYNSTLWITVFLFYSPNLSLFPSVQSYVDEDEEPRKKPILYEDLRLKNRENYEVTLIQKADRMLKAPTEKDTERGKTQGERLLLKRCSTRYSRRVKSKEVDVHCLGGKDSTLFSMLLMFQ
ncbi:hypothetical protein XENOCAPTIV_028758 [Xenoophorus captivus]|uniref:Uncharacterized protein n=1 Tax=Xenoophorus captivus TaxID=1517983 RepID=A0ABV0QPR0_9TELE